MKDGQDVVTHINVSYQEDDRTSWFAISETFAGEQPKWREVDITVDVKDGIMLPYVQSFYQSKPETVLELNESLRSYFTKNRPDWNASLAAEVMYQTYPYVSIVLKQEEQIIDAVVWDLKQNTRLTLHDVVHLEERLNDYLFENAGLKYDHEPSEVPIYLDEDRQVRLIHLVDDHTIITIPLPHIYLKDMFLQDILSY
jgi:hypothetical protein